MLKLSQIDTLYDLDDINTVIDALYDANANAYDYYVNRIFDADDFDDNDEYIPLHIVIHAFRDAFSIPVTEDDLIEWLIAVDALMEKDGELVPTPAAEKHQIYFDIPSRWYNGNIRLISKAFATCFTLMVNGTALTKEQTRGWTIKNVAPYGIVKIVADRKTAIYSSDEAAVAAAVAAGMSVIPEDELPDNFKEPRLGWVDNPINRFKIERHSLTQN